MDVGELSYVDEIFGLHEDREELEHGSDVSLARSDIKVQRHSPFSYINTQWGIEYQLLVLLLLELVHNNLLIHHISLSIEDGKAPQGKKKIGLLIVIPCEVDAGIDQFLDYIV